jgi:hypothetical protein
MISDPKIEDYAADADITGAQEEPGDDVPETVIVAVDETVLEAAPAVVTSTGKKRMGRPKKAEATPAPVAPAPATPGNGDEPYMDARTRAEVAAGAAAQRRNADLLKKAE